MTIKDKVLQLWARWLKLVRKLRRTPEEEAEMAEVKREIQALKSGKVEVLRI